MLVHIPDYSCCIMAIHMSPSPLPLLHHKLHFQLSSVLHSTFGCWSFWPELQAGPFDTWYGCVFRTAGLHLINQVFCRDCSSKVSHCTMSSLINCCPNFLIQIFVTFIPKCVKLCCSSHVVLTKIYHNIRIFHVYS